MKDFFFQEIWSWRAGGLALGAAFLLAVLLVKPIGVSTQFVIADGIVWNLFSDTIVTPDASAKHGYRSPNPYLNKSGGKYAKHIAEPLSYGLVFVLAMIAGGFAARRLQNPTAVEAPPAAAPDKLATFDPPSPQRCLAAFAGGLLVLFGARLAGGCTSGHMMSGMMQTSLSGYLFALGAFAAAVPTALLLYGREG